MHVVVLGCGPAGLMAAQGAKDAGARTVSIFSKKRKSELFGAQYLHEPIPEATSGDPVTVRYSLNGDAESYRYKVYGRNWDGTVSPEDLMETHEAWDIRDTYDNLWDEWHQQILDIDDLTPAGLRHIISHNPDLVINSIPRPALCHEHHVFRAQEIWAAGDAPARGIRIPYACPRETVLCDGTDSRTWYRLSNIFGHSTVEWSRESMPNRPPVAQPALVQKPIGHNCTCWGGEVHHVGRYGKWQKGVLSHTAYHDAAALVRGVLHDGVQANLPGVVL